MQGLTQKQAAEQMEESVVTARKRQQRIHSVLDPQAVRVDADPQPDATEGTSMAQACSAGTLAEVLQ
jgi:hypothetical protein